MAEKTVAASKKATTAKNETQDTPIVDEEINLDVKVTVRNLAGWDVTFARLHDGVGDIKIVANGHQRLSRNEVVAQVNNNNKLFTGVDTVGSHATVYIEDKPTRILLGFEEGDKPQLVFTEKAVKELFSLSQSEYKEKLPIYIRTRAEKFAFIETIRKLQLNDYAKIMFAVDYTGYKL